MKRKKSIHEFPCFKSRVDVIGFHSQEMDCGFIESIPCGNIFTAFLAIHKKISNKKAETKFDFQCYNTYSLTNNVIYEKRQRMDFSMNNTLA